MGDDLALNVQQVTGVTADRELPVVYAVAKGSALNKVILIPLALLLSTFLPWMIQPLLVLGGLFLCYEGAEKVIEKFFPHPAEKTTQFHIKSESEQEKIKGAIRTDFVLSAEIIVITLGTLESADFKRQLLVLVAIAILMTIGVYGLVAALIKMDDLGLYLSQKTNRLLIWASKALIKGTPYLMKGLGIVGTIAMFLVGGGILTHSFHLVLSPQFIVDGAIGLLSGLVVVLLIHLLKKLRPLTKTH